MLEARFCSSTLLPHPSLDSKHHSVRNFFLFQSSQSEMVWKKEWTKGAGPVQKNLSNASACWKHESAPTQYFPRTLHLTQNMALCFYFRPNMRCFAPKQNLRKGKSQHRLGHGHGHGKERKVVTCPNHPYILMQHLRSKWFWITYCKNSVCASYIVSL